MANIPLIGPNGVALDPLTGLPIDPRLKQLLAAQVFGPQEAHQSAEDLPSRQRFLQQNATGRETVEANAPQITPNTPAPPGRWSTTPTWGRPFATEIFPDTPVGGQRGMQYAENAIMAVPRMASSSVQTILDANDWAAEQLHGAGRFLTEPVKPPKPAGAAESAAAYVPEGWSAGGGGGGGATPWWESRQSSTGPMTVEGLRPIIAAQESGGGVIGRRDYTAINPDTGALGAYQVMPDTARALARRLNLEWNPQLMRQDTASGRAYQDKIGGAAIQEAIEASGGDPRTMALYYHGGSNRRGWGPRTQTYADEILGLMGRGGGGAGSVMAVQGENPYVSSGARAMDQERLGLYDEAWDAATQPTSTEINSPFIEPPKPTALPQRDFTASDAALERLRPAEVFEQDKRKMIRQGIFAGMAQAMASTPDGAGLGKVLAMFGAGALGGNVQGNEEVQRRMDRYDALMAQYNTAVYNNESNKSDSIWRTATANAQQDNNYAANRFEMFVRDNKTTTLPDGTVISQYRTPEGKMMVDTTSISALAEKARMLGRIDIMGDIAGREANGQAVAASVRNGIIGRAAEYQLARGEAGAGTSNLLTGTMMVQQAIDNRTIWSFLDEEDTEAINEAWMRQAAVDGLNGETALTEKAKFMENMIIGMVFRPEHKDLWDKIRRSAGQTAESIATRQARNASTSRSRTGVTVRTPGEND